MAARLAEVVCPPGVRTDDRAGGVVVQFGLVLGALQPVARRVLVTGLVVVDRTARLYLPARGRRFVRLPARPGWIEASRPV